MSGNNLGSAQYNECCELMEPRWTRERHREGPWRKSHVRRLGGTRVLVFRFRRLSESPPGSSRGWVLKVDTTNIPISQQCPPLSES